MRNLLVSLPDSLVEAIMRAGIDRGRFPPVAGVFEVEAFGSPRRGVFLAASGPLLGAARFLVLGKNVLFGG